MATTAQIEAKRNQSMRSLGKGLGQWPVAAEGKKEMADDRQMTDGQVEATGLVVDPVEGEDWNLVPEDSTNDENGILSNKETDAADEECQGMTGGGQEPKKAQNKANLESTEELD